MEHQRDKVVLVITSITSAINSHCLAFFFSLEVNKAKHAAFYITEKLESTNSSVLKMLPCEKNYRQLKKQGFYLQRQKNWSRMSLRPLVQLRTLLCPRLLGWGRQFPLWLCPGCRDPYWTRCRRCSPSGLTIVITPPSGFAMDIGPPSWLVMDIASPAVLAMDVVALSGLTVDTALHLILHQEQYSSL